MKPLSTELILIRVTGEDRPGLTASVTEILAKYDATILDIGQADIHNTLSLGILCKTEEQHSGFIMKELLFKASSLGVTIRFYPITAKEYEDWVSMQGKNRYILTLLGRKLSARQISAVTRILAEQGMNIDAIKRLTGRIPLDECDTKTRACIEFSVRGTPKDRIGMQEELMRLASELEMDFSFQLDNMYDFKADIAIILNITPDHLDRYNYEMQNYVDAKFRILQNQTKDDAFIFWNDDPIIAREIAKRHPEATLYPFAETHENGMKGYTENNQVVIETANGTFTMEQDLLALTGTHNLYNSLASGIASKIVDIHDEKIRASLSDFTGVEHRLEKVLRVRGVDYINDSKATNVNSCWYALQSMTTPVVLILGGTDKGNDYSEIEELVSKKVHSLIFMGVDNTKLHAFFDGKVANIEDARSMEEAVAKAYKMAHKGDTVLLSPCCASFDLFKSYEDRGDQFKACVRNL